MSFFEGLPSTAWKLKQQIGRVGRNGKPAVEVTIVFPQRGTDIYSILHTILSYQKSTDMKFIFKRNICFKLLF